MRTHSEADFPRTKASLGSVRVTSWVNLGGQLVRDQDCSGLIESIKSGKYDSWEHIHAAYERLDAGYGLEKQKHAYATLACLLDGKEPDKKTWIECLDRAVSLQEYVRDQVYLTRKKDYDNPIRKTTFRNAEEMQAVRGNPEDNSFVKLVRSKTEEFKRTVEEIKSRG
jgi:hypothetical protein